VLTFVLVHLVRNVFMPQQRGRDRDKEARDIWDSCAFKIATTGAAILVVYLVFTGLV
jgi:hypothetical protein